MSTQYTVRDNLLALHNLYSQAEIAAKLGVSERSLRRWKNSGKHPSDPAVLKSIAKSAVQARHTIERRARKYHFKESLTGDKFIAPIKVPKKFKGSVKSKRAKRRDKIIGYMHVKKNGKTMRRPLWSYKLSTYVIHDVSKLTKQEVVDFAIDLLKQKSYVQFIVRVPKSAAYVQGYSTTSPIDYTELLTRGEDAIRRQILTNGQSGIRMAYKGQVNAIVEGESRMRKGPTHRS